MFHDHRRAIRHLSALIAGLVVAAGLVVVGSVPAAAAATAPSGLTASDAAVPVFSWERVVGATDYEVQIARGADFASVLAGATTVNAAYVPTVELPTGELWWRVRTRVGSDRSDWTTSSFTPRQRQAPVPVQPQSGAAFIPPQSPRFSWEPVAGATDYTLQTSSDSAFADPALITERTQETTAAYLTSYPAVGRYYWRVRAQLGSGYSTAWSDHRPYDVAALAPVERRSPEDVFDKDDDGDVFVTDVVLDWEPRIGAATYDLRIDTDRNFLSVDHERERITGTRYSPPAGLLNDDFYWQVRPVDAGGRAAPWPSTPWRFTRAWPDQPEPVYPVGQVDADVPFFFEWDPIERASTYRVHLYDADKQRICMSGVTMHTTLAGSCAPDAAGDYFWRVEAFDDRDHRVGRAPVPTVLSDQEFAGFSYTPPPDDDRVLDRSAVVTGQAASVSGIAAYGLGVTVDSCTDTVPDQCDQLRQTPILTWDPVPGATRYQVVFTNDAAGTNPYLQLRPVSVSGPMWTPTSSFLDSQAGSAYFWRVLPCDASGCVDNSERPHHAFAKEAVAPRPLAPADGEVVADDVTLRWGSVLDRLDDPDVQMGSDVATTEEHDAVEYVVQTSLSPGESGRIETQVVDQTAFTSFVTTYPEGPVYWRVAAFVGGYDGQMQQSAWSGWRSFVKRSSRPTQTTPRDDTPLGQDQTLSWEPLAFAKFYDVEVYAGPSLVDNDRTPHSSWAPSTSLPVSDAPYTWRVRRVDAAGRVGEWTELRSFRIDGFSPSLAAPAAGQVVPPTGALFSWEPDPRATSYRFERRRPGTTSDLAETVVTRATAWAPVRALSSGTAPWRVVALDPAGRSLGASPWRDVVVIDPPRVVTPVTITGNGKIGTDLRLSAPTFDPVASSTTYQWFRASSEGGAASAIAGASGESYVLTSGDLGRYITVRAAGRLDGYQDAVSTSNAIVGVTGDAPVATAAPRITGTPKFDGTLTVVPGEWPGSPILRYQWFRDGVAISGATAPTYRLVSADVGRTLHVVETATSTGLPPGTAASDPLVVTPGDAPTAPAPTLSPDPATVGDTVTAGSVTWSPAGSYSYSYQWYRDGVAIENAASRSYQLAAGDGDHDVHVVVTASLAGRLDGTTTSTSVAVRQQPVMQNLTRPSISGTPKSGESLRAEPGSWATAEARFTYQWFRDDVAVGAPAGSAFYRLTPADAGRSVYVVVAASASGYRTGTSSSVPVVIDRLGSATSLGLSATRTTVKKRVTASVRVSGSGVSDPGGTVVLRDGSKRIASARLVDGAASVRLPLLKAGRHTIRVVYGGTVQVAPSSAKALLTVARGRR